mgnify:CR=1 FL=1|tara:strand:+ start:1802 stop:2488 length:687 start_codon:yes stop_codon:yes gene_type:complete
MSLTTAQHDILVKYLKDVEIKHQEPFEEFYDHIATAIENDKPEDVNTFLREVIQPSFGGVKGIKKIVLNQRKARTRMIWEKAIRVFFSFFGWPAIGIVMVSFILVQTSQNTLGSKFTLIASLILGLLLPLIVFAYGSISFYIDCKRSNKNYRNSDLNSSLMVLVHLPFTILNIVGNLIIPMIIGREIFKIFILENIWLSTFFCAFTLLYGFTCLKLMKEQFIFKLEVI